MAGDYPASGNPKRSYKATLDRQTTRAHGLWGHQGAPLQPTRAFGTLTRVPDEASRRPKVVNDLPDVEEIIPSVSPL